MSNSDRVAKGKSWLSPHWRDALFVIAFAYTLIVPFVIGIILVVPGAICMAFSQLHLLSELEIFKILKLKRELEQARDKAYATTDSMASLGGELVSVMSTLYGSGGRGGGAEFRTAVSNSNKLRQFLVDQLSFSPGHADACVGPADRTVESALAKDLAGEISDALAGKENLSQWHEDRLFDPSGDTPAPPVQWQSCIESLGVGDVPEVMEALKDYEHYVKFRELRRAETLPYG